MSGTWSENRFPGSDLARDRIGVHFSGGGPHVLLFTPAMLRHHMAQVIAQDAGERVSLAAVTK